MWAVCQLRLRLANQKLQQWQWQVVQALNTIAEIILHVLGSVGFSLDHFLAYWDEEHPPSLPLLKSQVRHSSRFSWDPLGVPRAPVSCRPGRPSTRALFQQPRGLGPTVSLDTLGGEGVDWGRGHGAGLELNNRTTAIVRPRCYLPVCLFTGWWGGWQGRGRHTAAPCQWPCWALLVGGDWQQIQTGLTLE